MAIDIKIQHKSTAKLTCWTEAKFLFGFRGAFWFHIYSLKLFFLEVAEYVDHVPSKQSDFLKSFYIFSLFL